MAAVHGAEGRRHLPLVVGHRCRHVGYESWLEGDHLVAMGFDRAVVGIVPAAGFVFSTDGAQLSVTRFSQDQAAISTRLRTPSLF
jgi:hypothetical protein